jgi:RNA polymerase sigma-70 factor (ECF subfamily)
MREHAASESDVEIVNRVVHGDADAFECLMDRYQNHVCAIVGRRVPRMDVEEVAHDIFVRAYLSLPSYRAKGDFGSWLSRISVRACCDYWRERYRGRERPMSALTEDQMKWLERVTSEESMRAHADRASLGEAREILAWALDRLSAEDRAVLELVHIEERPVAEAAELLGWSVANVKVRAFRSRRRLRAILEKLIAKRGGTR